jgi:hypothetical protein
VSTVAKPSTCDVKLRPYSAERGSQTLLNEVALDQDALVARDRCEHCVDDSGAQLLVHGNGGQERASLRSVTRSPAVGVGSGAPKRAVHFGRAGDRRAQSRKRVVGDPSSLPSMACPR